MENVIESISKTPFSKAMFGDHDINKWLKEGYRRDPITLIYGPTASGSAPDIDAYEYG